MGQTNMLTNEQSLLGMCAFDEVDKVIILGTIVRQNDAKQEQFRKILNRLRIGQSTLEDYEILKTRIFSLASNVEQNSFIDATRLHHVGKYTIII